MKWFKTPEVVTSILALCVLTGLYAPTAQADFVFGTPSNLGSAINTSVNEFGACLSPDGLELYLCRGDAHADIWVARRAALDSPWQPAVSIGMPLTAADNGTPFLTPDGLTMYFDGDRPGGHGSYDLWQTTRATLTDPWGEPVNLGPAVNSYTEDWGVSLPAHGLELYFTSSRSGGQGGLDLWMATRSTVKDPWGPAVNLGPSLNTTYHDTYPAISPDGLVLFFASTRPGGSGSMELYMSRRATTKDPWGAPMNLGPKVNSPQIDNGTRLSLDGSTLFFFSFRTGGFGGGDIYQVSLTPTLDFNGDVIVDATDMLLLADHWGQSQTLFDVGPFPWGDGAVDEQDLSVLLEKITGSGLAVYPLADAPDVSRDTVLAWSPVPLAETYDVYLGTSFEQVDTADADHSQDVLLAARQTVLTYDLAEPLEFGRTYYWRVDFVGPAPAFTVYKGLVRSFTTEPYAYPIRNVIATASSSQANTSPARTVDGSGLDGHDRHSVNGVDMWQSTNIGPHWIQFEFDQVYALHELWVWNANQLVEPFIGFGAKTVRIEYSTDGVTWTTLEGVPEFAKASGKPDYAANTLVNFGGVPAQYVRLNIDKGWGVTSSVGLSEVRFFYIPDRSTTSAQ